MPIDDAAADGDSSLMVRLPTDLLHALSEAAQRTGLPDEELMRLCLECGIEVILSRTATGEGDPVRRALVGPPALRAGQSGRP